MKKLYILTFIILILFINQALGQNGLKIYNKKYFEHFAILLRDTSQNSANIFVNEKYIYKDYSNIYNKSYLVDSLSLIKCEKILLKRSKRFFRKKVSRQVSYIYGVDFKQIRDYIRLYIGYFDEKGNKIILIQFVTLSEYIKHEKILSKEILFYAQLNPIPLRYILLQLE